MIEGRYIRLEPFTRDRASELFPVIAHPGVFEGGYGGGPAAYRDTEDEFVDWALGYFPWDKGNPYLAVINTGPHRDRIVGTTTLGDFEPENESTHIGWTALDPRVWGTAVNPESKLLLLGLAFDSGFGRVKIQADALNLRSRAAIAKLGATFEGIARRDKPRADGTWRDSAISSIILDDWPPVKARLIERLDSYAGAPVTLHE